VPQAVTAATYNANNQQLTFGTQTLTYDLNGNLTSDGANTYTWDARNRLVAIAGPMPASFVYDAAGRRSRKTINGVTTDFLYDGLNPVQEQSGSAATSLLTGLAVDEYLSRGDATSTAFSSQIHWALLLRSLTMPAGSRPNTPMTSVTGTATTNPFDFNARETDLSGMKYYRARYYHSTFQRFTSLDPLGFEAGDANLYSNVRNAPTRWTDPDGLRVLNPNNYVVSPDVLRALEQFNECVGQNKDILITGGNRPPTSQLGAGAGSTHAQGLAADIVVLGQAHSITAYQAIASGLFGGIGWYEEGYRGPRGEGSHVHVDLRLIFATWGYDRDGNYYRRLPPLSGRKSCEALRSG
jgi:RHS repeat-associated protein